MPQVSVTDSQFFELVKVELDGTPVTVGTSAECAVRVSPSAQVAPAHCRLAPRDGAWVAEDVSGELGTYFGVERLTSARLRPGQVLRVGPYRVIFESTPAEVGARLAELARQAQATALAQQRAA